MNLHGNEAGTSSPTGKGCCVKIDSAPLCLLPPCPHQPCPPGVQAHRAATGKGGRELKKGLIRDWGGGVQVVKFDNPPKMGKCQGAARRMV